MVGMTSVRGNGRFRGSSRCVLLLLALSGGACSDQNPGGPGSGGQAAGGAGNGGSGGTSVGSGSTSGNGGNATTGGSGPSDSGGTTSSGGASATGGSSGSGGASGPCENANPALLVTRLSTTLVSEMGLPFDPDEQDDSGPTSWGARYGKTPEIMAATDGDGLRVLFQDQDSDTTAYVVHVAPSGDGYAIDAAFEVESLGRIMGLALDEAGNYFVATGVAEDEMVDASYPPNDVHRPDIVRISKFDSAGCVTMESDVDMERGATDGQDGDDAEIIVNPMVAASSRLAYGNGQLVLVHGHNTEPDEAIGGQRHQKAITTHLDAMTGAVTRASSMWVSHSFDQRAFYDGVGFMELHLGDAYPRTIVMGRYHGDVSDGDHDVFAIKGPIGENETFTRLGGIVQTSDPTYGYLVTFSTERTSTFDGEGAVQGTRDLALVRVRSDFADAEGSVVEEGGDTSTLTVMSGEDEVTNSLRWLTDLGPDRHVERPRIVALSGTEFVLLWEEWTTSGSNDQYQGTFAMTIDAAGQITAGPSEVPDDHHISRGDDAVRLGTRAVYVTGSSEGLHLNLVAADLTTARITLP